MHMPDYTRLRKEAGFHWYVNTAYPALLEVHHIPMKEYFLNPSAGIELYRKGWPVLKEMFGPDVNPVPLHTPPISYGHVNGLGAELLFPEDGEVNHSRPFDTLEQGIAKLKEDVDFAGAGMAPFYMEYRRKLMETFDTDQCGFSYGYEGPMTTAYTLRGDKVFYDPYDNPELFTEFMELMTTSIVAFAHFSNSVTGEPKVDPSACGMCDDLSAMFNPQMWPKFVIPYWDQYYNGLTTGKRKAHVEDLRPEHLHFLNEIGLVQFDPSISPKINPAIIRDNCRVPFGWRLGNFHYPGLTCEDIHDWVFQAAADGASFVFTYVSDAMCNDATIPKVRAFIDAAKEAEQMFNSGVSREEIGQNVSEAGRKRFWDRWPE